VDASLRELARAMHRTSTHGDATIRASAATSLVTMAKASPLVVLQTWLDQFARTNGGSSPAEYAAVERVYLLQALEKMVGAAVGECLAVQGGQDAAGKACVGRIIAMATEEIVKQKEVVPDVQKPCSGILVALGDSCLDRVMDSLLLKFQVGQIPHYYIVNTIGGLAQSQVAGCVPYLKGILETMVTSMRQVKKDNLKYAYASVLSHFADAIVEFLANSDNRGCDPTIGKGTFQPEMDTAHDVLFSQWLQTRDNKAREAVLLALGRMARLLTAERLGQNACQLLTVLVATYKRVGTDPIAVTECISHTVEAVGRTDPHVMEPVVEQLLTALFTQVVTLTATSVR